LSYNNDTDDDWYNDYDDFFETYWNETYPGVDIGNYYHKYWSQYDDPEICEPYYDDTYYDDDDTA
jgi:hypothetical protein